MSPEHSKEGQTQERIAKALALMVNTFGTSHKELSEIPTKFQIATQQARDALALSGNEELIADHLIQSGVWKE